MFCCPTFLLMIILYSIRTHRIDHIMRGLLVILIFLFVALALSQSLSLSFIEKGTMPFGGLAYSTSTVIGSKIYFISGTDNIYSLGSNITYSYDTETDEWSELGSMTYFKRYGMCSATDGEQIWVFGGYDDQQVNTFNPQDQIFGKYFINNNTWIFNLIPKYVFGCSAAYIPQTQKVLVVYGFAPAWLYDPSTDMFEDLSANFDGNSDDNNAGSVLYDGKLWLAGGGKSPTALRTVTTDGLTWQNMASNPNGLGFLDMVRVGDVMLTFGGTDFVEYSPAFSRINMYNITSDTWTTLDVELPRALSGISAKLMGPSIYLFGGVYNPKSSPELNDKYWVVPCVAPEACVYGCNMTSGRCLAALPPMMPPVAEPVTAPMAAAPVASPVARTPQTKASSTSLLTTGISFVIAVCVVVFM